MWKSIFEILRQMLTLTESTQKNTTDIKELRQAVKDLSDSTDEQFQELRTAIERLAFEIQRISERETHEREKLISATRESLAAPRTRIASASVRFRRVVTLPSADFQLFNRGRAPIFSGSLSKPVPSPMTKTEVKRDFSETRL